MIVPTDRCEFLHGDCREVLRGVEAESVHMVVTSPPYWSLRDYGLPPSLWGGDVDCEHVFGEEQKARPSGGDIRKHWETGGVKDWDRSEMSQGSLCLRCGAWRGCLGLEPAPELFIAHLVEVFREVRRVLRKDGTCWVNIGDCYLNKQLMMMPAEVALALRRDGWWLRCDCVWAKQNPMPESVTDRPTRSHEYVFLLSKSPRYYYDADSVREESSEPRQPGPSRPTPEYAAAHGDIHRGLWRSQPNPAGRNLRSVWTLPTEPYSEAHFATYPTRLVEPCVKAGTSEAGCCPKCGAPWKRMTEPTEEYAEAFGGNTGADADRYGAGYRKHSRALTASYRTLGWQPSCPCDAGPPVPCTVLDPFGGSGTTGAVATRLGRRAILIDQSEEYLKLARKRIAKEPTRLFAVPGEVAPRRKPPTKRKRPEPEPARYVCPETLSLPEVID